MEQTAKTKTIKIVCIVLAIAIVVAGIITGIVAFFNSNFYRFRMSAFTGEYIPSESVDLETDIVRFRLWENPGEFNNELPLYCFDHNEIGEIKLYQLLSGDNHVELESVPFDESIYQVALNYTLVFEKGCTVKNNKIIFANDLKVKITESKREKYWQGSPYRSALGNDNNNASYRIEFTGSCVSPTDPSIILLSLKHMWLELTTTVIGRDNKEYTIRMTINYNHKEDYISYIGDLDK